MSQLKVGQVLRYARPYHHEPAIIGGYENYFHITHCDGRPKALLEAGINPIGRVGSATGDQRTPAILISSSPHREGGETTPWRDLFDVDNGHIRYFGDAKTAGADPAAPRGNKALLAAHALHASFDGEQRAAAPPIVFFRRTAVEGAVKGHLLFQGFGVVERVERISQFNRKTGETFTNYAYDFAVLSMAAENELFDWAWINSLRTPSGAAVRAPAAWREYVDHGPSALSRLRRRVAKLRVVKAASQLPTPGSSEERVLRAVYAYYQGRNHRFEGLAYEVAKRLLSGAGNQVVDGWITPRGGDGGGDFVARLDIGQGFGSVRQIVYGQAKCVAPSTGTDGRDIARTVARLKRGWFGVFVTTGHFSDRVQMEVIEDEYPILLVSGLLVAQQTTLLAEEAGLTVGQFLERLDAGFDALMANRRPEEVLHSESVFRGEAASGSLDTSGRSAQGRLSAEV